MNYITRLNNVKERARNRRGKIKAIIFVLELFHVSFSSSTIALELEMYDFPMEILDPYLVKDILHTNQKGMGLIARSTLASTFHSILPLHQSHFSIFMSPFLFDN